jgi:hypothetical protein
MIVEAKARLEIELREKRKEHKKRALPGGIDEDEEPEKVGFRNTLEIQLLV